jgi:hypothetical protein
MALQRQAVAGCVWLQLETVMQSAYTVLILLMLVGVSRLRGPILTLAVGLVLFTVVRAGYFIHWLLPSIPLPAAFALAAVLSPTDAVAVSAIARDLEGRDPVGIAPSQTLVSNSNKTLSLYSREWHSAFIASSALHWLSYPVEETNSVQPKSRC